jgi:hypothetical protein
MKIIEEVKELLEELKFTDLYKLLSQKNDKEIESILFTVAYDYDSLLVYTFINAIIQKNETANWHYIASSIMATAFNQVNNGYQIAYYHALKAIELSPESLELKNYILLFYSIPERLLNKDLALDYARAVYDYDNNNNAARQVLGLPLI